MLARHDPSPEKISLSGYKKEDEIEEITSKLEDCNLQKEKAGGCQGCMGTYGLVAGE